MKFSIGILFFLVSIFLHAQSDFEKYPLFPGCEGDGLITNSSECFYSQFYAELRNVYKHPNSSSTGVNASIRFEIDRNGAFVPILVDASSNDVKEALTAAMNNLVNIKPATYNGQPTFMQFVVNVELPLVENGSFQNVPNSTSAIWSSLGNLPVEIGGKSSL